jgi:hypothetical protein
MCIDVCRIENSHPGGRRCHCVHPHAVPLINPERTEESSLIGDAENNTYTHTVTGSAQLSNISESSHQKQYEYSARNSGLCHATLSKNRDATEDMVFSALSVPRYYKQEESVSGVE